MNTSGRKVQTKPTLNHLERRIDKLEQTESWAYWISRVAVPLVSLIVAVIGLLATRNAIEISKNAFDLNVEPVVYATVHTNRYDAKLCTLWVENQGINPIYDVRIRVHTADIDYFSKRSIGQTFSRGDWQYQASLGPRDTLKFTIDPGYLDNVIHNAGAIMHMSGTRHWVYATILFYTAYRRMPDKRLYRNRTLLYLLPDSTYSSATALTEYEPFLVGGLAVSGPMLDSIFIIR